MQGNIRFVETHLEPSVGVALPVKINCHRYSSGAIMGGGAKIHGNSGALKEECQHLCSTAGMQAVRDKSLVSG